MEEKFKSKLELDKFQYEYCSVLLWGAVVVDRKWAEDTKIFIDNYKRFLESYNVEEEKKWKAILKNLPLNRANDILSKNIFYNRTRLALAKWQIENVIEDISDDVLIKKLKRKLFRYKIYYKIWKIFQN